MNITFVEVILATSVVDLKKTINETISKHRGTANCCDIKYEHCNYGAGSTYSALLSFEANYYDHD